MLGSNASRHCKPRNQVSISRRKTHPQIKAPAPKKQQPQSSPKPHNQFREPNQETFAKPIRYLAYKSLVPKFHSRKNENSKNEENEIRRSCGFSGVRIFAFLKQPATGTPPRYRDATGPARKDQTGRLQSKHQTTERRPASPSASRSLAKTLARTIANVARPKEIGNSSRQDSTGDYVREAV